MPDRDDIEIKLQAALLVFVFGALFPRLAYLGRWPTRLGPRGLAIYILVNTAVQFALRAWLFPWLKQATERHERVKTTLREELGREPTDEEVLAGLKAE